ncbi:hypothetical protein FRC03_010034 [Tulasnella sp. 419]|nr:hypothetical protein FRC03_010034 [Tulasnella sp. 419]
MAGLTTSNPATLLRPSPSVPSVRANNNPTTAGNSTRISHPVLTIDQALSQANGNVKAALEAVLAERNILSGQNAQLWKLIEKQRTQTSSVMKELERIRSERDKALAKIDTSGDTPARTRTSPSGRTVNGSDESDVTRPKPLRHQSENSQKDRNAESPTSKPSSTSSIPARTKQQNQRSLSHGNLTASPQGQQAQLDQSLSEVPQLNLTSPPSSGDSGPTANPPLVPAFSQSNPSITVESSPTVNQVDLAPIPPTSTSSTLSTFQPRARASARESRITLPDEATHYIANMQDSPLPSPHLTGSSGPATNSLRNQQEQSGSAITNGAFPHSLNNHTLSPSSPVDREGSGTSSSGEGNPWEPSQPHRRTPTPPEDTYASSIISGSSKVEDEDEVDVASSIEEDDGLFVDNGSSISFQPPASQSEGSHTSTTSLAYGGAGGAENETLGSQPESSTTLNDSPYRAGGSTPTRSYPQLPPPIQNSIPATPPTHPSQVTPQAKPTYRSTRLTSNDLPYTKVRVQGSNIRTNDRGKEVLSFVFAVDPCGVGSNPMRKGGSGKESWLIEKLYSEILALDSNVRSTIGRSGSKKLPSLPDGKLFRDHAPAKVDQRKAVLETYIQSLVTGTWKGKDDILMFLSTDFVRSGQRGAGVGHSGYKEGYLTKRGKNFGGWKTRYFVLQSPVLEYYESRGGQHLGSIAIAGAQIGRQQKSNSARESDDENSYRHAFLIIEAKKGPGGAAVRHVLCAESDEERDSWVELLVRYVIATAQGARYPAPAASIDSGSEDPRSSPGGSISTLADSASGTGSLVRASVDQQPMASLQKKMKKEADGYKHSMDSTDERESPVMARRVLDRGGTPGPAGLEVPSSSQVTSTDNLSTTSSPSGDPVASPALRPNMVLEGANSSERNGARASPTGPVSSSSTSAATTGNPAPHPPPPRSIHRASYHPSAVAKSSANIPEHRAPSPEKIDSSLTSGKVKISGPIGGQPIPPGYKFGKEQESDGHRSDRERKAKSRTFWGFGRNNIPAPNGPSGGTPQAVFGVPLETSLAVAQIADLPAIVFRCIQYLEAKKADQEEGIYRLSGSSAVIKSLKDRFNAEGDVDLLKSDEFWDPHAIAGLLKSFLRELPQSILTRELHLRFLGVIDLANSSERIDELAGLISQLPLPNYSLLRALTAHLILIVQNANVNKMTMRNVGIVFSPTLGIPAGVFSLMLGEFEKVFNVYGQGVDIEEALKMDPDKPAAVVNAASGLEVVEPLSNRNSRSYADGAADRLLGLSGRTLKSTEEESDEADSISIPEESDGTETENEGDAGGNTNILNSPPDTPGPSTYVKGVRSERS